MNGFRRLLPRGYRLADWLMACAAPLCLLWLLEGFSRGDAGSVPVWAVSQPGLFAINYALYAAPCLLLCLVPSRRVRLCLSLIHISPVSVRLVFHPISVSGETSYNNYQPVLLVGDDAQRVLDKMADSTAVSYTHLLGALGWALPWRALLSAAAGGALWALSARKGRKVHAG